MTDEQLDKQIHDAYANILMSPEAEERILANLLAAEKERAEQPAGEVVAFPAARRRRRPSWVAPAAIAAVLLVGIFMGMNLRPSYDAASGPATASNKAAETYDAGEAEIADYAAEEAYPADSFARDASVETVVLQDGSRFAIEDVAVDTDVADDLLWEGATIESTGDPCEVVRIDDATLLVRFEGEDTCYRAVALGD